MGHRAQSRGLEGACFLWSLLPCLVLLFVNAGCEWQQREKDVAQVDGVAIAKNDIVTELRGLLWRRGESWATLAEATRETRRKEAVDRCIEQKLITAFAARPANPATKASQLKESEDAFQQFLKQFEPPDGWKQRFELQGVNEVEVRGRISTEVAQDSAIEAWLKAQRTLGPEQIENEARKWFEAHRGELRLPERARVSHLFLTAHDPEKPDRGVEITELHRKLTAGEMKFEELAAKFSNDERSRKTGGQLGWIGRNRVPKDFGDVVFALPLQKPSAPFRTKLGWHIAVVHEKQAARLPEFREVREEIVARLDQAWREAAVEGLVEELRGKAKVVVEEGALKAVEP